MINCGRCCGMCWRREGSSGAVWIMWRVEEPGIVDRAPDVARFVDIVNRHADFFERSTSIIVARAPGRLDLMGGIADYSGSLVLELPLAVATFVAAQPSGDGCLTV